MQLGYKDKTVSDSAKLWPIYICFFIFGVLIAFTKESFSMATLVLSVVLSLAIGFLMISLLILAFNRGNSDLTGVSGQFAREAVGDGMLFMIPFTALALIAQVILGWDAVMPFASAGVMTAATSTGSEIMKKGAQGIKNVMIPSGLAFLVSTSWMILIGTLP